MAPEDIFKSAVSLSGAFLSSSNLSFFTSVEPSPYSKYEFGSTKLLNTDPVWIRIYNTACSSYFSNLMVDSCKMFFSSAHLGLSLKLFR